MTLELWDILDENGNKTGKTIERGKPTKKGEYNLVVHVWIQNSEGEYLIQKRAANKTYSLLWAATGGHAITGDDSLRAALREVKEELGLDLSPDNGVRLFRIKRDYFDNPDFLDVWLFKENVDINSLTFHPDEVCGAMWAKSEDILTMIDEGLFVKEYTYLNELFQTNN